MSEPTPAWGSAEESEERKHVRQRLEARRALVPHAAAYLLVNVMLVVIWAATGGGYFWPIWPMIGWGIGLGFNALAAYGPTRRPITDADVDAELRRRRPQDR